ncbi:MFS transporter [Paractinoplanes brasiliensis]|uniref:Sugar phosphate permease n=1 Tax=Paractinoplanes brasiliensis TaxID=52695 RepID=A0A4R6J9M0_9ACTN|nr:MFS transporter [Actinoplanes brasiliensis]TDO31126.1 sugar phosphate permease [Actinoplanes brasiliensis]GID28559.1 MFS transporter [Actinoplanes brasiliensis]
MTGGRRAAWVAGGYAAQGLGYATLVTALPQLKDRQQVDDTFVSVILLLVCVAAAAGSVVADRVAARLGSRYALAGGLLTIAVALALITVRTPTVAFTAILILYGVGLGAVDASLNMQGVLAQVRMGRSVMNRLFAAYTAAAITAALLMSAFAAGGAGASFAVGVAALFAAAYALTAWHALVPDRTVVPAGEPASLTDRTRHIIWICGAFVLTGFLADSAVSTWSSIYLDDSLSAPAAIVPLGYAAYQAMVLLSRLTGDHLVPRVGRTTAVTAALLVCAAGCLMVTLVPTVPAAITGFALTGLGVGLLIPIAFSAAGEAAAGRSDAVLARVNLFNYAGALLGAVLLGALSEPVGLRWAFLIPVLGLLLTVPVVRALRHLPTTHSNVATTPTPLLPK